MSTRDTANLHSNSSLWFWRAGVAVLLLVGAAAAWADAPCRPSSSVNPVPVGYLNDAEKCISLAVRDIDLQATRVKDAADRVRVARQDEDLDPTDRHNLGRLQLALDSVGEAVDKKLKGAKAEADNAQKARASLESQLSGDPAQTLAGMISDVSAKRAQLTAAQINYDTATANYLKDWQMLGMKPEDAVAQRAKLAAGVKDATDKLVKADKDAKDALTALQGALGDKYQLSGLLRPPPVPAGADADQAQKDFVSAMNRAADARDEAWALSNPVLELSYRMIKNPKVMTPEYAQLSTGDLLDRLKKEANSGIKLWESVQRHPSVAAFVGGSGAKLSSTAGGSKVTLKQTVEKLTRGDTQFAITLEAPFNDTTKGISDLVANNARLDKLAGAAAVGMQYNWLVPSGSMPDTTGMWLVGGDAKLGFQRLKYYDTAFVPTAAAPTDPSKANTPKSMSVVDRPVSVNFRVGYIPAKDLSAWIISAAYQGARESQTERSFCAPSALAPYVDCVAGPVGPPQDKSGWVSTMEYRRALPQAQFAFSTSLSHDSASGVKGFELAIFPALFSGGRDVTAATPTSFNAGVSLSWRSDTKWTAGVFAGVPFSLFGDGK